MEERTNAQSEHLPLGVSQISFGKASQLPARRTLALKYRYFKVLLGSPTLGDL